MVQVKDKKTGSVKKERSPQILSIVIGKTNIKPFDMNCLCLADPPKCNR